MRSSRASVGVQNASWSRCASPQAWARRFFSRCADMTYDSEGAYELDDLDRQIIAALRADGRATNQQIARSLKIAAATVSMRIRRMERLNTMRGVTVTDFAALGYTVLLAIGIEVKGRPAEDVAKDLANVREAFAVP